MKHTTLKKYRLFRGKTMIFSERRCRNDYRWYIQNLRYYLSEIGPDLPSRKKVAGDLGKNSLRENFYAIMRLLARFPGTLGVSQPFLVKCTLHTGKI
jgi:hypothetical protein